MNLAAMVGMGLFLQFVSPYLSGAQAFIAQVSCAILNRFLPSVLMAAYLMTTTTVSETIIIPLFVMFHLFRSAINNP